jgi:hypothetical protein
METRGFFGSFKTLALSAALAFVSGCGVSDLFQSADGGQIDGEGSTGIVAVWLDNNPGQELTPVLIGDTVPAGLESFGFYADSSCEAPIGSGTRTAFMTLGIEVRVGENTTTTIFVRALDARGAVEISCGRLTSYTHDTVSGGITMDEIDVVTRPAVTASVKADYPLSGTCAEDDMTISIYRGATLIETGILCSNGSWEATIDISDDSTWTLGGAGHQIRAGARDPAGNASSPTAFQTLTLGDFRWDDPATTPVTDIDTTTHRKSLEVITNFPEANEILFSTSACPDPDNGGWETIGDEIADVEVPNNNATNTVYAIVRDSASTPVRVSSCLSVDIEHAAIESLDIVRRFNSSDDPDLALWNNYVEEGGADDEAPVDCDATNPNMECIHTGERVKAFITDNIDDGFITGESCTGLTVTDSLGAFNWECIADCDAVTLLDQPCVRSTGLKTGKSLGSLITSSGTLAFRNNSITITTSQRVMKSPSGVWWRNPVRGLPAASTTKRTAQLTDIGETATPGTPNGDNDIYVLRANDQTKGISIRNSGLSLVVMPGKTLKFKGKTGSTPVAETCIKETGEDDDATPANNNDYCLVSAHNQDYLWIEGLYSADSGVTGDDAIDKSSYGILLGGVRRSRVHASVVSKASYAALSLVNSLTVDSSNNVISESGFNSNTDSGIFLLGTSFNLLKDLSVASNGTPGINQTGINLFDSDNNTLSGIQLNKNNNRGIYIAEDSDDNKVSTLQVFGSEEGVSIHNSDNTKLTGLTVKDAKTGVVITADGAALTTKSDNTTFQNLLLVNNDRGLDISLDSNAQVVGTSIVGATIVGHKTEGIRLIDASGGVFHDVISSGNGTGLLLENDADRNLFSNLILTDNDTGLFVDYDPDVPANLPNRNKFRGNIVISNNSDDCSFRWNAATTNDINYDETPPTAPDDDDIVNECKADPAATQQNLILPSTNVSLLTSFKTTIIGQAGRCTSSSCPSFDGRIKASASPLLNRSFNFEDINANFSNGASCPSDLRTKVIDDVEIVGDADPDNDDDGVCEADEACYSYLRFAREILGDLDAGGAAIGDDDGLCEIGEGCTYQPNFGHYIGAGDVTTRTCTTSSAVLDGPDDDHIADAAGFPLNEIIFASPNNGAP